MDEKQAPEWTWLVNPKGRPVEVLTKEVPLLLKQGYTKADPLQVTKENMNKEFLEVIKL